MGLNSRQSLPLLNLLDHPGDHFAQGLAEHRATGLADGRQAYVSPLLRTVVPQLGHQGAVRQEYEIHMPGLALATPELTRAHAQMLLAVPMEGLCPCLALAIGLENAMDFPIGAIGNQDLAWFCISLAFPQPCVLLCSETDAVPRSVSNRASGVWHDHHDQTTRTPHLDRC